MGKFTGSFFDPRDVSQMLRRLVAELAGADLSGAVWRRKGKQSVGLPIDIVERLGGGGKQTPGIGVDVINMLRDIEGRLDKLAEHSGVSTAELRLAASLSDVFRTARASGISRETVATRLKDELERAFAGK
jgi:hypothetical protein